MVFVFTVIVYLFEWVMSYHADKLMIDTHMDRRTDITWRPKMALIG